MARVISIIALATSFLMAYAQPHIGQSQQNECRHVTILSREKPSSYRSTNCFMPFMTASSDRIRLHNTLHKEATWTLNHRGAVDGQLFYVDHKAVYFLTQKICLDAGNATGFHVQPLYDKLSNKSAPIGMAGAFHRPGRGDILRGCLEDTTSWGDFVFKQRMDDKGTPLPPNVTQSVRSHVGLHEGKGVKLIPFTFNYTADDLEQAFRSARVAASRKRPMSPSEDPQVRSGTPFTVIGYPFESGHSVLGSEKTGTGKLHKDLFQDITVLAWNRLQEAVASLTGRPTPPVLLPEAITDTDLLTVTVLAFISIISFRHALLSTAQARRERVLRWPRNRHSTRWTYIQTAADHKGLCRYPAPTHTHEMAGALFAFIVAAIAIIGAILHFRSSNIRYRKFMLVQQGSIITYGPSEPNVWALDPENAYAGAVFAVGHWYVAQTISVGFAGIFEVILVVYCVAGLSLLLHFYRFVTFRENQLDKARFRGFAQLFRSVPQAVVGFLVSYVPGARLILRSYLSTYQNIAADIVHHYELPKIELDETFSKRWDGVLKPKPWNEQDPDSSYPTPDQVEKASAFLASDRLGRLLYPQVVALLSSERLMKAADAFHRYGTIPTADEIRSFSHLFYLKGILLPEAPEASEEGSENGLTQNNFTALNLAVDGDGELIAHHERLAVLLAFSEDADAHSGVHRFALLQE